MSTQFCKFIEKHLEKPWHWGECGLSKNPSITPKFIEAHPEKPWNWSGLSRNPSITPEFIETHPEKPWDWGPYSVSFLNDKFYNYQPRIHKLGIYTFYQYSS